MKDDIEFFCSYCEKWVKGKWDIETESMKKNKYLYYGCEICGKELAKVEK